MQFIYLSASEYNPSVQVNSAHKFQVLYVKRLLMAEVLEEKNVKTLCLMRRTWVEVLNAYMSKA